MQLITKMATEEVKMLLGISEEIHKMENNMERIKCFLADAERRHITDLSVQRGVQELKNAMYDVTDILDLYQIKADKHREPKRSSTVEKAPGCCRPLLSCLQNLVFAHKIGSRIKKLNQRLDNIHKQQRMSTREKKVTSEFVEFAIVGEKIEIETMEPVAQMLTFNGHHDIKVVAIVGTGGVGKTALETTVQGHFKMQRLQQHLLQWCRAIDLQLQRRQQQLQPAALVESLSNLATLEELVLISDGPGSDEPCGLVIAPGAFSRLQYMKMNSWPIYQPGAMPCLESVELSVHVRSFNDANFDYHHFYRLRCLRLLEKAHVAIICSGAKTENTQEVEATLWRVVQHHPNCPILILERFGRCANDKQLEDSHSRRSGSTQREVDDKQICDKLNYSRVAPEIMSLELLKKITKNFSKKRELGRGTFGTVYEGVHNGKRIAVKRLHPTERSGNEEEFRKEYENLRRLDHPNIIQLIGYCYEIKLEFVQYQGRSVLADNIYRALCFDYMHNGSLQRHLKDEFHGLDWQTRYKIIKGTCEGLKYLHEGLDSPMYHLDLKPDNILLGKNMVPKLADFGLSKLVCDNKTQSTSSSLGTRRYIPPEYIERGYVSNKFDIFSLGVVMIEIIAGPEGYCKAYEMPSQEFIAHVQENWRKRLLATPGCTSLIYECRQVQRCLEIALACVSPDRKQRPNIGDITSWLNETET